MALPWLLKRIHITDKKIGTENCLSSLKQRIADPLIDMKSNLALMEELMATLNSGHSKAAQANLIEKYSDESIIKEAEARMAKLFQLIE